ncbi:MAG: hypothetical protein ACRCZI_01405, partial [Cetobacterium sp.]
KGSFSWILDPKRSFLGFQGVVLAILACFRVLLADFRPQKVIFRVLGGISSILALKGVVLAILACLGVIFMDFSPKRGSFSDF